MELKFIEEMSVEYTLSKGLNGNQCSFNVYSILSTAPCVLLLSHFTLMTSLGGKYYYP